jgi:hypothetical protein
MRTTTLTIWIADIAFSVTINDAIEFLPLGTNQKVNHY